MTLDDVRRLRPGHPVTMRVLTYGLPGALMGYTVKRGRVLAPWVNATLSGKITVEWDDGSREVLGEHNLPFLE